MTKPYYSPAIRENDIEPGPINKSLEGNRPMPKEVAWRKTQSYSWAIHPLYKVPRVIAHLERLFILGMNGDVDAIKLFLDRTLGKQAEALAIAVGAYDQVGDTDLLTKLATMQNVVQRTTPAHIPVKDIPPDGGESAVVSQEVDNV